MVEIKNDWRWEFITKTDVVNQIWNENIDKYTKRDIEFIINSFIRIVGEKIKNNFKVKIEGLGTFSTYYREVRFNKPSDNNIEENIPAVKYISFKLLGYSNVDAYAATFPDRYERLKREGQEQIEAFASMYNKNKLVMQIYEQTIVPTYVLNAPLHQEALNELAKMIKDPSVRGMTKVKACEAILQHTKQPEIVKGELTIGIEQQDTISELRDVVEQLAEVNRLSIAKNIKSIKEVAEAKIIDVTPLGEDYD